MSTIVEQKFADTNCAVSIPVSTTIQRVKDQRSTVISLNYSFSMFPDLLFNVQDKAVINSQR